MRKLVLFIILCLIHSAIVAQITQTQLALVTKKTDTWCESCGTFGWTLQEDIEKENSNKSVILQVHYQLGDHLYNSISEELQNAFPPSSGIPAWYVNCKNRTVYGSSGWGIYVEDTRIAIKNTVDSTYNTTALANCSYSHTLTGDVLTVYTNTKFFSDTSGKYYLSALLVENDVVAYQGGIGDNAHHMNVLRGSMSTSAFGELITSNPIPANTTYYKVFTKTLNPEWNYYNLTLALVIWKKVGNDYIYVNAYKDGKILDIEEKTVNQSAFTLYPNPTSEKVIVEYNKQNNSSGLLSIYSINGQLCLQLQITQAKTEIDISSFEKGVYILKLNVNNQSNMIKVMKE